MGGNGSELAADRRQLLKANSAPGPAAGAATKLERHSCCTGSNRSIDTTCSTLSTAPGDGPPRDGHAGDGAPARSRGSAAGEPASAESTSSSGGSWRRWRGGRSSSAHSVNSAAATEAPAVSTSNLSGASSGASLDRPPLPLHASRSLHVDLQAAAAGASGNDGQQQRPSKWKHRLKKALSFWYISPQEMLVLRTDRRELRALRDWGIDPAAYRTAAQQAQAGAYSLADWESMQDILMFHTSKGASRSGAYGNARGRHGKTDPEGSVTLGGRMRDRHGWWHLDLECGRRQQPQLQPQQEEGQGAAGGGGGEASGRPLDVAVWCAGFDQCSKEAEGAASCGCCALEVARWLAAAGPGHVPADADVFAELLRRGAAAWRAMCADPGLGTRFPDGHFDLETVFSEQQAHTALPALTGDAARPLMRLEPGHSFVAFLRPPGPRCEPLEAALSGQLAIDDVWRELQALAPATFIVSWHEHFSVLRLEGGPQGRAFLIDSLGRRLHAFCCCAFAVRCSPDGAEGSGGVRCAASGASQADNVGGEGPAVPSGRTALDKMALFFTQVYAGPSLASVAASLPPPGEAPAPGEEWLRLPGIMHKLQVDFSYVAPLKP